MPFIAYAAIMFLCGLIGGLLFNTAQQEDDITPWVYMMVFVLYFLFMLYCYITEKDDESEHL